MGWVDWRQVLTLSSSALISASTRFCAISAAASSPFAMCSRASTWSFALSRLLGPPVGGLVDDDDAPAPGPPLHAFVSGPAALPPPLPDPWRDHDGPPPGSAEADGECEWCPLLDEVGPPASLELGRAPASFDALAALAFSIACSRAGLFLSNAAAARAAAVAAAGVAPLPPPPPAVEVETAGASGDDGFSWGLASSPLDDFLRFFSFFASLALRMASSRRRAANSSAPFSLTSFSLFISGHNEDALPPLPLPLLLLLLALSAAGGA
jgi:hypothetical protein